MKNLLVIFLMVFGMVFTNAQLQKGDWVIEANTLFGEAHPASTAIQFATTDGNTAWAVGGEVGYFIAENFALKAGLGINGFDYDGGDSSTNFTYKIGGKYYINSKFPVQLDLTGASLDGDGEDPLYLGLQGGYAWFIADNVSVEPGLRYGFSLNEDYSDKGIFSLNVGFAIHL